MSSPEGVSSLCPSRSPYTLHIKFIPVSWDENDLVYVFQRFGTVLHCRVIRTMRTGESRRFGFLEFDNYASALSAIGSTHHSYPCEVHDEYDPLIEAKVEADPKPLTVALTSQIGEASGIMQNFAKNSSILDVLNIPGAVSPPMVVRFCDSFRTPAEIEADGSRSVIKEYETEPEGPNIRNSQSNEWYYSMRIRFQNPEYARRLFEGLDSTLPNPLAQLIPPTHPQHSFTWRPVVVAIGVKEVVKRFSTGASQLDINGTNAKKKDAQLQPQPQPASAARENATKIAAQIVAKEMERRSRLELQPPPPYTMSQLPPSASHQQHTFQHPYQHRQNYDLLGNYQNSQRTE